jgi:hypothetical protein
VPWCREEDVRELVGPELFAKQLRFGLKKQNTDYRPVDHLYMLD